MTGNHDLPNRPIGVFDSGMGGLTVMRALMARLPHESFVYLGDTARLPYGSKSPETVTRYAVQCARALSEHRIKLLVVACNTASAVALPALEAALKPTPIVGVIEPGADAAAKAAPLGRIAVIATEGTVKGGAYVRAIHARNPNAVVTQQACPLFVALAEEGLTEGAIAELELSFPIAAARLVSREGERTAAEVSSKSMLIRLWTYGFAFRLVFGVMGFVGFVGAILCLCRYVRGF